MKRFISTILATLLLVTAVPLTSLAADWTDSTYHEDQDESPKISYQKAYSYLSGVPESDKGDYAIRCVNSPKPQPTAADNYPDDSSDEAYWKATSDAPYFAVSYKMTVKSTATWSGDYSWYDDNTIDGKTVGGTNQGWLWSSSSIEKGDNARMGITLGLDEYDGKGLGYSYGFFGFGYSTNNNGNYSNPVLIFGPTGYEREGDRTNSNWLGEDNGASNQFLSPFCKYRVVHDLSAVPVYDKDGKTELTLNFVDTENVIMLVGSYINNEVTLKAYINGYQIRKIWKGEDTFSFTDETKTSFSGTQNLNFTSSFGGQFGFINQLNNTFAYARFTRSSHPLDQNAFNVHHAKVDASRPDDDNTNWYNDQANQWKVDMKHFAAEYTIEIENKQYSYINSGSDLGATSLNCGLVLGRQSRDPDKLLGTIDFRFTDNGNGKCSWGSDSKLWFGPDNHENASNRSGTLGLEWRSSEFELYGCHGTNYGTTLENSYDTHTVLITGDYDAENKKATIKVWLDGKLINSWFGDETVTITNFGDFGDFGDGLNYIGWRTNVKGVNAVARFTQWDEDANLDYAAAHGTVFDYKTAGPMTGYWDRTVTQNSLAWGEDSEDTFDAVSYIAYNEAWEDYEHPNNNAYQLGMITDTSRSFIIQADIPYKQLKGFYISPEYPTDDTNDGLNIGMSDGGMDDIRKWYNKYYYIQLRESGHITTWVNVGDGDAYDSRWIIPDVRYGNDTIYVGNVIDYDVSEYIGVRVEYSNKTLSIWVKEGGEDNPDSEYVHLYTINNLDSPNIAGTGNRCNANASNALLEEMGDGEPLFFGLMVQELDLDKNEQVEFKNVKVSYGLQSPSEIHESEGIAQDNKLFGISDEDDDGESKLVIGAIFDKNGNKIGKNTNVVGFTQTREGSSENTYDLRVAVEGDDIGLYRKYGYDAVIRVVFKNDKDETKSKSSYSHHWAYYEFSFYDAEYYFHAAEDCGLISAVFTNIPEDYTSYYVFVDFYEKGVEGIGKEKVRVYLGSGTYDPEGNTLHGAGGSPAPDTDKNGTENVDKENERYSKMYSVRPAKNQRYYEK